MPNPRFISSTLNTAGFTITSQSAMPPDHEQWATRNLNTAVAFFNYLSSLENITLFCSTFKCSCPPSHPYLEASPKPLPLRSQIH